jgi:hypothetical protein
VTKKLAVSYPKIICVLVDLHVVPLTGRIHCVLAEEEMAEHDLAMEDLRETLNLRLS